MAGNGTNPFTIGDDSIVIDAILEENLASDSMEEEEDDNGEGPLSVTGCEGEFEGLSLDTIAAKLLRDRFILTALEMHMELTESGRELARFRDFFSNPANFERGRVAETSPPRLPRTSSVQTFDSLDFARYSDDGEKHESDKVAVLEFELRKAQETIKSLRAALTKAAETELASPENSNEGMSNLTEDEPVQSYEKRALNFLINEYLLKSNYKLTSVTFSEENVNQDFEDWDDVGINISKPPDLIHLYRGFGGGLLVEKHDFECMASLDADINSNVLKLETEQQELSNKILQLENELKEQKIANELLENQLKLVKADMRQSETGKKASCSFDGETPIRSNSENASFEASSALKVAEEDTIENGKDSDLEMNTEGLSPTNAQPFDPVDNIKALSKVTAQDIDSKSYDASHRKTTEPTDSENPVDSHHPSTVQPLHRQTPVIFRNKLLSMAFQTFPHDNRILSEISKVFDSSEECVMLMLGRCLPHIVPNVLLAKREELIPIIICTVSLHPDPAKRDELMSILFNLIKRPDPEQRQMILSGCMAFAQHAGPIRVESELLPQCWEQITHKYVERRLLVAEACGVLAPYIPNEMRSSLVLSILQQMLEDKLEEVREAVIKSLGIVISFVDNVDKFQSTMQLLFTTLNDSSERVIRALEQVFLPSLAMWAMELERLEMNFVQAFLDSIEKVVQPTSAGSVVMDGKRFSLYVKILQHLVSFLFVSVLSKAPFAKKLDAGDAPREASIPVTSRLTESTSDLLELSVIIGSTTNLNRLAGLFEDLIAQEWHELWPAYSWVCGDFVPQLLNLCIKMDVSQIAVHHLSRLFYLLCRVFGHHFTLTKVRARFEQALKLPEDHQNLDRQLMANSSPLNRCVVPVYAAGILIAFGKEDEKKRLTTFLQDMLSTLALHHSSLASLQATFTELCLDSAYHELLLKVLWDGVVHTSALIRGAAGRMFEFLIQGISESLVATRVIPALITLASDPEITVRIATIGAFGMIIECIAEKSILDKVYMQFQAFMDDPLYKDHHLVHIELVRTFGKIGPNAEPKFRDDFILPRLTALAVQNQLTANETRKADVALQLFEAYSAMSCCFISDQLVQEVMLPGLRCLLQDLQLVAPDHVNVVTSMIREFEDKLESNSGLGQSLRPNASLPATGGASSPAASTGEAVKSKMLSRFKDVKDRASQSNFSKIFTSTKK